ncbi:MAG: hypothetical protein L3J04_04120 [Robiginitomaculum sp.]|nr:hypothetical protein [Robiginitomaculum sp.]
MPPSLHHFGGQTSIAEQIVDHTNRLVAMNGNEVLLSTAIAIDGKATQIDVSCEAIWRVKIKISINGKYFAGDQIGSEILPSYQAT